MNDNLDNNNNNEEFGVAIHAFPPNRKFRTLTSQVFPSGFAIPRDNDDYFVDGAKLSSQILPHASSVIQFHRKPSVSTFTIGQHDNDDDDFYGVGDYGDDPFADVAGTYFKQKYNSQAGIQQQYHLEDSQQQKSSNDPLKSQRVNFFRKSAKNLMRRYPDTTAVYRLEKKDDDIYRDRFATMDFEEWFLATNGREKSKNSFYKKSLSTSSLPSNNNNLHQQNYHKLKRLGQAASSKAQLFPSIDIHKKLSDSIEICLYDYFDVISSNSSTLAYETFKCNANDCDYQKVLSLLWIAPSSTNSPVSAANSHAAGKTNGVGSTSSSQKLPTLRRANYFSESGFDGTIGTCKSDVHVGLYNNHRKERYRLYFYNHRVSAWRIMANETEFLQAKLICVEDFKPLKLMMRDLANGEGDEDEADELQTSFERMKRFSPPPPSNDPSERNSYQYTLTDVLITSRPTSGNLNPKQIIDDALANAKNKDSPPSGKKHLQIDTPSNRLDLSPGGQEKVAVDGGKDNQQSARGSRPSSKRGASPGKRGSTPTGSAVQSRRPSVMDTYTYNMMMNSPPPLSIAPTFALFGSKSKASITNIMLPAPIADDETVTSIKSGKSLRSHASVVLSPATRKGDSAAAQMFGSTDRMSMSRYTQQHQQHPHSGSSEVNSSRDPRQSVLTMTYSRAMPVDPNAPKKDKQESLALALEQRLLKTRW